VKHRTYPRSRAGIAALRDFLNGGVSAHGGRAIQKFNCSADSCRRFDLAMKSTFLSFFLQLSQ